MMHQTASQSAHKQHNLESQHAKAVLRELASHLGHCAAKRDWQAFLDTQSSDDETPSQRGLND